MNKEEVIELIKGEIATVLEMDTDSIDDDTNFLRIGVSSIQAIQIINRISRKLGTKINPSAIFEYKTISEFGEYLCTSK